MRMAFLLSGGGPLSGRPAGSAVDGAGGGARDALGSIVGRFSYHLPKCGLDCDTHPHWDTAFEKGKKNYAIDLNLASRCASL